MFLERDKPKKVISGKVGGAVAIQHGCVFEEISGELLGPKPKPPAGKKFEEMSVEWIREEAKKGLKPSMKTKDNPPVPTPQKPEDLKGFMPSKEDVEKKEEKIAKVAEAKPKYEEEVIELLDVDPDE